MLTLSCDSDKIDISDGYVTLKSIFKNSFGRSLNNVKFTIVVRQNEMKSTERLPLLIKHCFSKF